MCGITGVWETSRGFGRDALAARVGTMTDQLSHRGPDDSGTWVSEDDGLALGHRRLAIVDLSAEGHQPMLSEDGRYVVVFNGEIYNFPELSAELLELGHHFRGHSDTEVLLAATLEWGVEGALRRFQGMFAYALWDRRERALYLARDRMGEKPLYYGWVGDALLFASELKALRAHPLWTGEVDRDALALFLRFNYVPAPYSIHAGIGKLLPGTLIRIEQPVPGVLPQPTPYWDLRTAVETGGRDPISSPEDAVRALDELLRDAVRQQMVADVPLGAFLSGGVDSSTVVALMQAQSARPVRTFTIGFDEEAFNEAEYAKAVANHLGTDHVELYVRPDEARTVIPRLPELYDEPFADSSQIPTFLLSQLARSEVTVALSGDGGDELFGGYNRYHLASRVLGKVDRVPAIGRRLAGRALQAVSPQVWDRVEGGIAAIRPRALPSQLADKMKKLGDVLLSPGPEAMYTGLVSNWLDPEEVVVRGEEAPTWLTRPSTWPKELDTTSWMMYIDTLMYLPDDILTKVDRAAMGVSLETRIPMLDHRVVEFAWRLPLDLKVRDGQGKWVLRQVLDRYVPRTLIERPKMGFGVPIAEWLRGPLRDWAEALLDEKRLRAEGYLRPEPIRRKWAEHLAGTRNWQFPIWSVLVFQAWLEHARDPVMAEAVAL